MVSAMDIIRSRWIRILFLFLIWDLKAIAYGYPDTSGSFEETVFRSKRRVQCAEKFATISNGHTACLQRSPLVKIAGISSAEKQQIVDEHNRLRRNVYPPARNMREMSWDDELATIAQKWTENCEIGHDKRYQRYDYGRFDVGQNLCWSTYKMSWEEAMGLWSNETRHYQYGRPQREMVVAHYTQIIWAETSLVGCGYAHCEGNHFYVCNYGPTGNYDISKPYESGQSCADCPHTCRDKLCDCRGKVCLNGGKMDLKTCTCECNKEFPFYVEPFCELNCTNIQEPEYCREQFGQHTCEVYSNVPHMCPEMCKWCPSAGMKYDRRKHHTIDRQIIQEKHSEVHRTEEDNLHRTQSRHDRGRADQTISRNPDPRRRPDYTHDSRRRHENTVTEAPHTEQGRTYKDSDLVKVATIVEKQLTVKIQPMVQTYVSSVMKQTTKELEMKNKNLLKEVGRVSRKYNKMENELDSMELYSRRNALRVSGVPEKPKESTDDIIVKIASAAGTQLRLSDIDYSHRVGKAKGEAPRDVIVRFVSHNAKKELYDVRARLAKSSDYRNVMIYEYLTRKRKKLLGGALKLVKNERIKKAWTQNGKVYIINLNGKRKLINNEAGLRQFKNRSHNDNLSE